MAILITHEGGLLEFEDRETVNRVCDRYEFEGKVLESVIERELRQLDEQDEEFKCMMVAYTRGQHVAVFMFWRFMLCGSGEYTPCYLET
jgi:hypothetical protein